MTNGVNIEPHSKKSTQKLNWLRAAVLGANDGIVSTASLVLGVAGATDNIQIILTAGIAGLIAGALSMGVGEYISVSAQRDTERALITKETGELTANPKFELNELTQLYVAKGLTHQTAAKVASELTAIGALPAHLEVELNIDPENLANPWLAAFASAAAFLAGAIIPIIMVTLPTGNWRIPTTFIGVIFALTITGFLSAKSGEANKGRAILRVVLGGVLAMITTYGIGKLFGVSGI